MKYLNPQVIPVTIYITVDQEIHTVFMTPTYPNGTVQTGVFPDSINIAKVIAIYKTTGKENVSNYRPNSLLPSVSKLFEKIVHKRLYSLYSLK